MGDWFVGEIRAFPYGKIPQGWLACNGAVLNIQNYAALYALLNTTYGGDGRTTFGLPDLRGRTAIGRGTSKQGTTYKQGVAGGAESVALTQAQIPPHTHLVQTVVAAATTLAVAGNSISSWGTNSKVPTAQNIYATPTSASGMVPLNPGSVLPEGGGAGHENMQPFQVLNLCIAYQGVFPPHP
jgi:microcystin-dependent protein